MKIRTPLNHGTLMALAAMGSLLIHDAAHAMGQFDFNFTTHTVQEHHDMQLNFEQAPTQNQGLITVHGTVYNFGYLGDNNTVTYPLQSASVQLTVTTAQGGSLVNTSVPLTQGNFNYTFNVDSVEELTVTVQFETKVERTNKPGNGQTVIERTYLGTTGTTTLHVVEPGDEDGDGYGSESLGGADCDDTKAAINPGASEIFNDGIDNDCDPLTLDNPDADEDGFYTTAMGGTDCNDLDSTINPDAQEIHYDGIDNDCNNATADGFAQVSTGNSNNCALKTNGSIVCWGIHDYQGQLSDTPTTGTYKQVSVGLLHACALSTEGHITCWGIDGNHQVSNAPEGVFKSISAGKQSTCAVDYDGVVTCWGDDSNTSFITQIPGNSFIDVQLGNWDLHSPISTCALDTEGSITCWKTNEYSEIPQTTIPGQQLQPISDTYTQMSLGFSYKCALNTEGQISCWGKTPTYQYQMPPEGSYTQVSSGESHSCALDEDGFITCWGTRAVVEQVPDGQFSQISLHRHHGCAIDYTGRMQCWGYGWAISTNPAYPEGTPESAGPGAQGWEDIHP